MDIGLAQWQFLVALLTGALLLFVAMWFAWHRIAERRETERRIAAARVRSGHVPLEIPTVRGQLTPGDDSTPDTLPEWFIQGKGEHAVVDEQPRIQVRYFDPRGQKARMHDAGRPPRRAEEDPHTATANCPATCAGYRCTRSPVRASRSRASASTSTPGSMPCASRAGAAGRCSARPADAPRPLTLRRFALADDAPLMHRRNLLGLLAASSTALVLAACGKRTPGAAALKPGATVLALGDSLTAGHGAGPDDAWPNKLSQLTGWAVVNEGLNGDTSLGALQRLEGLLAANRYDAILVGIGGNDMLRGMPPRSTIDNLTAIVRQARAHTPHVGVIATPAPEPMRAAIGSLSDALFYEEVAKAEQALLIPKVYARVLSDAALRSDRIHANAQGYAQVAQQVAQQLQAAGWR